MGLFKRSSSKDNDSKKVSRKEQKRIEQEEKQAQLQSYLTQGQELEAKGKFDDALRMYYLSSELPKGAIKYLELLKKRVNSSLYFEKCCSFESKYYKDIDFAPILISIAECYKNGYGTEVNIKKAYDTMQKYEYAMKSHTDSSVQLFLGKCAYELDLQDPNWIKYGDKGNIPDYINYSPKVQIHFEKAADKGNVEAMLELAKSKDAAVSCKYYKMACEAGSSVAASKMFWRFIDANAQHALPSGFRMEWLAEKLSKGANAGDVDCMFALALCYAKGFVGGFGLPYAGTKITSPYKSDQEKFIFWLKKAYNKGSKDPGVKLMMAEYYILGKIWRDNNFTSDPIYTQTAKEIDMSKGLKMLESIYKEMSKIDNMILIHTKRMDWFHACRYLLGMMHFDGYGTKVDIKKATEYVPMSPFISKNEYITNGDNEYILIALRKHLFEASGATEPDEKTITRT